MKEQVVYENHDPAPNPDKIPAWVVIAMVLIISVLCAVVAAGLP